MIISVYVCVDIYIISFIAAAGMEICAPITLELDVWKQKKKKSEKE